MTIDCQIFLYKNFINENFRIDRYHHYFNRIRNSHDKQVIATKIIDEKGYFIPDSTFSINIKNKRKVFCLELHRGYRILKIEKQLKIYGLALKNGNISAKYNLQSNPRVLVVFENKKTMESTLERIQMTPFFLHLKPYFFFILYDDLLVTPLNHRCNLSSSQQPFDFV